MNLKQTYEMNGHPVAQQSNSFVNICLQIQMSVHTRIYFWPLP